MLQLTPVIALTSESLAVFFFASIPLCFVVIVQIKNFYFCGKIIVLLEKCWQKCGMEKADTQCYRYSKSENDSEISKKIEDGINGCHLSENSAMYLNIFRKLQSKLYLAFLTLYWSWLTFTFSSVILSFDDGSSCTFSWLSYNF